MRFSISLANLRRLGFHFIEEGFCFLIAVQAQIRWKGVFSLETSDYCSGTNSLQMRDDEVLGRRCQREASPFAH